MAALAAASTFFALTQIYDEISDHFTLGEYDGSFQLTFFSKDNIHLNDVMSKIKGYIQEAEVTYGYFSNTKKYLATINFEF